MGWIHRCFSAGVLALSILELLVEERVMFPPPPIPPPTLLPLHVAYRSLLNPWSTTVLDSVDCPIPLAVVHLQCLWSNPVLCTDIPTLTVMKVTIVAAGTPRLWYVTHSLPSLTHSALPGSQEEPFVPSPSLTSLTQRPAGRTSR